ncbi:MAG: PA0069 family radical SAM protein [Pseudomonadota bacterium]
MTEISSTLEGMSAGVKAATKGRGAISNRTGRYETYSRSRDMEGVATGPKTTVTIERPQTILTYNKSSAVGFDRSINPYRGCEHGCVYCFARPTHAYLGLSPGLDFEHALIAKPDAPALLRKALLRPQYRAAPIAIGTNTDPYQPIERSYRIMRDILKVLLEFNHPVTVLTKSASITRDIDLLSELARRKLCYAMISITTNNKKLARAMEPRASSPAKRFDAVASLSAAGVPAGVMTSPMIPSLNDHEMEGLLECAKASGASFAGYSVIRLPLEVSELFQEWLSAHEPNRAARIMRHIRDNNGGRDYDPHWSRGGEIKAPYAKLIASRFRAAINRFGLTIEKPPLDCSAFAKPKSEDKQLSFFDESERE